MRLWRFAAAAFLYDWLAYVAWTVIPIRAETLGASATVLALLQTSSTAVYTLSCILIGPLADRRAPSLLARLGGLGAMGACLAIGHAGRLGTLFLAVPCLGLAGSFYWPSIQGALGKETDAADMEKSLAVFNVMWSVGKSLGFLTAGRMTEVLGPGRTMMLAASAAIPILLIYPGGKRERPAAPPERVPEGRAVFRTLSYIANFVTYGAGSVFQNQFYKYLTRTGLETRLWPKTYFGVFLGLIFSAQTLTFIGLRRGSLWTYRRALLYGAQALVTAASLAIVSVRQDGLILCLAPLVGVGLGFTYASSIYYSLHGPAQHGKYAGLHEAALGTGAFLLPLAGGALADLVGDLRAPYWLAAAAVLGAIGIEEVVYRRSSRS